MGTISPLLRQTLQGFNENPNSWGDILNDSALRVLEDGISGIGNIVLTGTSVTLTDAEGISALPTHSRWAILNVTGSPGGNATITVPAGTASGRDRSKIYLVNNATTGGFSVSLVTDQAGTTAEVLNGATQWVWTDGTDFGLVDVAVADNANTAALATDSLSLGGVLAANYARLDVAQSFTAGQHSARIAAPVADPSTGFITIDCALSNAFYLITTRNFTLQAPSNANDGQQFTLAVQQGGGGSHTISFQGSTFVAADGATPVLSTAIGAVDYLGFEYIDNLVAPFSGPRWVVSILKNLDSI